MTWAAEQGEQGGERGRVAPPFPAKICRGPLHISVDDIKSAG